MLTAISNYLVETRAALDAVDPVQLRAGVDCLQAVVRAGRTVYVCGNGGSAATASHLAVDLGKNVASDARPRVVSLTDNVPWLTALANDDGFANCFAGQLINLVQPGDLVIGISASGQSENVIRAFEVGRQHGAKTLALVGFGGGRLAEIADCFVHVDSYDYGIVESVHLIMTHLWVRMLREEALRNPELAEAVAQAPGLPVEPLVDSPTCLTEG